MTNKPSPKQATWIDSLISWLALPVYIWQGLGVRRNSIRMSPPPARGRYEQTGTGKPVRILVIGDSSAAGVGVDTFEKSIGGQLLRILGEKTGRPVIVRVAGNNSATSDQIRDFVVPHLERDTYDHIALNIGTNDAKNFHTGKRFCRNFGTLLYALRTKFPNARIIWSGVLDLEHVPALPSPLNRILGIRSRVVMNNGRILCRERGAYCPGEVEWDPRPENFSADGFHAGENGYREWAEILAQHILEFEAENQQAKEQEKQHAASQT